MSAVPAGASDGAPHAGWAPDRLLPGFEARQLPAWVPPEASLASRLAAAGRDDPVLTLVRPVDGPDAPRGVVVHLHGYNDYFFQTHLVTALADEGWAFLAVDARRCGRSWRPDEVPHYQADLREQADDLGQAVRAARALHPGVPVVVHGHSTGGLVAALWSHAHREHGGADALVLDSPFFSVTNSWIQPLADTALPTIARRTPLRAMSTAPSRYAARLLDRWDFDTTLKTPAGVPARAAWLAAVRSGQLRVGRGLAVPVPVLLAHSARSGLDALDNPDLDSQDTVLDVVPMVRIGLGVGPAVTEVSIEGGVHDLALSTDGPREVYLRTVLDFLKTRVGG
ncbi:MAG: alpha/beta hydrolase [Cellulomonas sp.]|nr:alpha/beta hydrolase [Cellulomonas sp.]